MNALDASKVAVCYSGLPNIDIVAIDVLLEKTGITSSNADLICCFWNVNVDKKKIDILANKFRNARISFIEPEIPDFKIPRKYYKFPETHVERVLSMLFARKKLLALVKEQRLFYDLYITTRPDIFITQEIYIQNMIDSLGKKCNLYLPIAGNYRNGFTDVLAISDYIGLEIYLSTFDKLEQILSIRDQYVPPKSLIEIIKEIYSFFNLLVTGRVSYIGHRTPFHPETITRKNLELSGLKTEFFDVGLIKIQRNTGRSTLMVAPKTSTLSLAKSLIIESIDDVDISIESLFKIKKVNK